MKYHNNYCYVNPWINFHWYIYHHCKNSLRIQIHKLIAQNSFKKLLQKSTSTKKDYWIIEKKRRGNKNLLTLKKSRWPSGYRTRLWPRWPWCRLRARTRTEPAPSRSRPDIAPSTGGRTGPRDLRLRVVGQFPSDVIRRTVRRSVQDENLQELVRMHL